ncbi:unnamed protein product [Sphenostylis stenocarpa]|uniref:Uncharacterized protein n=1 Tax=Sphenostylis stenocarpa TaxID=92480 RepID=A0AA86VFU7_9FABA|nr:unnamed protein product [Sphenostylis stenocarpa]
MSWEGAAKWVVGINEFFSSAGIVDVTKNTTRKRGATRGLPRSTLKLRSSMGSGALVLGMIAPAKCCAINGYMDSTDTRLTCDA